MSTGTEVIVVVDVAAAAGYKDWDWGLCSKIRRPVEMSYRDTLERKKEREKLKDWQSISILFYFSFYWVKFERRN